MTHGILRIVDRGSISENDLCYFLLLGAAPEPRLVGQETAKRQAAHDPACHADEDKREKVATTAPHQDTHPAKGRPGRRQVGKPHFFWP